MQADEIDRLLSKDEVIVPSSGFTAAVMRRIEKEVAAPAPIRFAWGPVLALLGIAAVALGIAATVGIGASNAPWTLFPPPITDTLYAWTAHLGTAAASIEATALVLAAAVMLIAAAACEWTVQVAGNHDIQARGR